MSPTNPALAWSKRATWLIILFLGEMLTRPRCGLQGEIEKAAFSPFLPLVIQAAVIPDLKQRPCHSRDGSGRIGLRDWYPGGSGITGAFRWACSGRSVPVTVWQYLHIFNRSVPLAGRLTVGTASVSSQNSLERCHSSSTLDRSGDVSAPSLRPWWT